MAPPQWRQKNSRPQGSSAVKLQEQADRSTELPDELLAVAYSPNSSMVSNGSMCLMIISRRRIEEEDFGCAYFKQFRICF